GRVLTAGAAGLFQLLTADRRLREHVARALEPSALPATRRRAHPLFGPRSRAAARDRARGLRARVGGRLLSDNPDLPHRLLERSRRPQPRLKLTPWPASG